MSQVTNGMKSIRSLRNLMLQGVSLGSRAVIYRHNFQQVTKAIDSKMSMLIIKFKYLKSAEGSFLNRSTFVCCTIHIVRDVKTLRERFGRKMRPIPPHIWNFSSKGTIKPDCHPFFSLAQNFYPRIFLV